MMWRLSLFFSGLILIYSCGPSAEDVAREIRKQDSITVTIADSIRLANKISALQAQYVAIDSVKNELQKSFDAALTRLDSLTGYNNELEGKLNDRVSTISKLKGDITSILKKRTISDAERRKVTRLIYELNDKVSDLIKSVSKLNK